MQDKRMGPKTATGGNVILPNEVCGLVIASLYWIKIWPVRWKVSDQSSCTIYNQLFHFSNMINCMALPFGTKLKDGCIYWKKWSYCFFSSYPVYVYNSNTLEIRKMNRPRIALEYRTKKLMQMISLRSYYVMNIQL